jgi:focal adhesion kinase 1
MKPTPTAKLERTNDMVYEATTSVVRAVMVLSQGVQSKNATSSVSTDSQSPVTGGEGGSNSRRGSHSSSTNHLENVKNVGIELRALLSAVDNLVPAFPSSTHREVGEYYNRRRY